MDKCPQCARVGDDIGKCGSHMTCPLRLGGAAVKVDPDKDIVLGCDLCGTKRAVPVAAIVHSRKGVEMGCRRGPGTCEAKVIPLNVAVAPKAAQRGKSQEG